MSLSDLGDAQDLVGDLRRSTHLLVQAFRHPTGITPGIAIPRAIEAVQASLDGLDRIASKSKRIAELLSDPSPRPTDLPSTVFTDVAHQKRLEQWRIEGIERTAQALDAFHRCGKKRRCDPTRFDAPPPEIDFTPPQGLTIERIDDGKSVWIRVVCEGVLQASIVMRGKVVVRIGVFGLDEEATQWGRSKHAVFQRVSGHSAAALAIIGRDEEVGIWPAIGWLRGYRLLFTTRCCVCGHILKHEPDGMLPPTWREPRTGHCYHPSCVKV